MSLWEFIKTQYGDPPWVEEFRHNLKHMKENIMALTAQVQSLVDAVAANTSAVNAAIAGLQAEATQIAALQAQIAAIAPGQPVDQEDDLDAITKAVTDLSATNTALQTAVPANVKTA